MTEATETLFVIHAEREDVYAIEDTLAMISWSCAGRAHYVIVVDNNDTCAALRSSTPHHVVKPVLPAGVASAWHCMQAVQDYFSDPAAAKRFLQVFRVTDRCLFVNQGVDAFFASYISAGSLGVAGVGDPTDTVDLWQREFNFLLSSGYAVAGQSQPNISLRDDVLVFSAACVSRLIAEKRLVPADCHKWSGTYGEYIAWACYFSGFAVAQWGMTTKVLPPLYVQPITGRVPPPMYFNSSIAVVSPITNILGYAEQDIRELYKQTRGGTYREVAKIRPVVYGMTPTAGGA